MSEPVPEIDSPDAADMCRAVLEELLNVAAFEIAQARHKHTELAHGDASVHTDHVLRAVNAALELEKALVAWQERAAAEDQDAKLYDLAESRWEQERDLGGAA